MKRLLLAAGFATIAASAQAATTFYSDLIGFAGATNGTLGLSFESFEETPLPGHATSTMTFDWGTVMETNGGVGNNRINDQQQNTMQIEPNVWPNPVADGDGAIWYHDNGNSLLTFTFFDPITAFGVFISSTASDALSITNGAFSTTGLPGTEDPNFWGVVTDTAFSSITFSTVSGERVGFDELKFGNLSQVPLPASGLLLLAGVGALGLRRRKR
ncbi:VPLPA-CTERM sorting domain-containing protein [Primorskyibacter sp. 2E107]|uniref:VPLPA-CTERM sorting domain-containing protein n=1 Tax=Primorskyibacter sp. 2E107 TaxID=3403458 RepID=UPI003AF8ACD8